MTDLPPLKVRYLHQPLRVGDPFRLSHRHNKVKKGISLGSMFDLAQYQYPHQSPHVLNNNLLCRRPYPAHLRLSKQWVNPGSYMIDTYTIVAKPDLTLVGKAIDKSVKNIRDRKVRLLVEVTDFILGAQSSANQ